MDQVIASSEDAAIVLSVASMVLFGVSAVNEVVITLLSPTGFLTNHMASGV
ncbi:hypothetical protein KDA_52830 [Dictyobacter alpinus]|uniref:Uncharacterized protein n=1 Tax=Dictyobacter alpinus TaxID=2014873 RepID=A0A402BEP6_9CHLR|nr:hypothetical protein KDA_52830 [Dictyobacter alpinus]